MASNNLSKGKAKSLGGSDMIKPSKAKTVAPRPAPAFLSALQNEEVDFPRGGGSSLTPLELKQSQVEGRREADAEATASIGKRRRSLSEREAKRLRKESPPKRKHEDSDTIRVEQLNYKVCRSCLSSVHVLNISALNTWNESPGPSPHRPPTAPHSLSPQQPPRPCPHH